MHRSSGIIDAVASYSKLAHFYTSQEVCTLTHTHTNTHKGCLCLAIAAVVLTPTICRPSNMEEGREEFLSGRSPSTPQAPPHQEHNPIGEGKKKTRKVCEVSVK